MRACVHGGGLGLDVGVGGGGGWLGSWEVGGYWGGVLVGRGFLGRIEGDWVGWWEGRWEGFVWWVWGWGKRDRSGEVSGVRRSFFMILWFGLAVVYSARTDKCQPHFELFSIEHHPP